MADLFPLPAHYGVEIIRSEVGSTLHGTGLEGAEDRDEMGIYLEHPNSTLGLHSRPHWTFRTAEGDQKSTARDTDIVAYSARKWAKLALSGNPSVLLLLFSPPEALVLTSKFADELRRNTSWFASRKAGNAFLGYMTQQRQRMMGQIGSAGRIRRTPDGSPDFKYAMHMLRLGYQGIEFLTTGKLVLPVPGHLGDHLRQVRQGNIPLLEVLDEALDIESKLKALLSRSPLPPDPETDEVEEWLIRSHLDLWGSK